VAFLTFSGLAFCLAALASSGVAAGVGDGDCADAKRLLGTFERVLAAFENELRQFE